MMNEKALPRKGIVGIIVSFLCDCDILDKGKLKRKA
jgi:hypothetical protein